MHAVSVGEVGVARSLLEASREGSPPPAGPLGDDGGRQGRCAGDGRGRVPCSPFRWISPAPWTALAAVRPGLILLTETEIWPLFLQQRRGRAASPSRSSTAASRRGRSEGLPARAAVVRRGARQRDPLFAHADRPDAERIVLARRPGASESASPATSSTTCDPPPPFPDAERLRRRGPGRPVIVAGSTREGEEPLVLDGVEAACRCPPSSPWRRGGRSASSGGRRSAERRGAALCCAAPRPALPAGRRPCTSWTRSGSSLRSIVRARCAFHRREPGPDAAGTTPSRRGRPASPVVVGPHTENFREVAGERRKAGDPAAAWRIRRLCPRLADSLADPAAKQPAGAAGGALRRREPRRGRSGRRTLVLALLPAGVLARREISRRMSRSALAPLRLALLERRAGSTRPAGVPHTASPIRSCPSGTSLSAARERLRSSSSWRGGCASRGGARRSCRAATAAARRAWSSSRAGRVRWSRRTKGAMSRSPSRAVCRASSSSSASAGSTRAAWPSASARTCSSWTTATSIWRCGATWISSFSTPAIPSAGDGFPPRGRLREPLVGARPGGAFVFTRVDRDSLRARRPSRRLQGSTRTRRSSRRASVLRACVTRRGHPWRRRRCSGAVSSASAGWRARRVPASLEELDLAPEEILAFRDHQRYGSRDLARIAERRRQTGSSWIATTEKDAVKLAGRDPRSAPHRAPGRRGAEPGFFGLLSSALSPSRAAERT